MSLMKVEDALSQLLENAAQIGTENIPLHDALGRVLAQDLTANRDQPPFDSSAMDGYAVKAANLANIPVRLQVVGEVPAGHRFPDRLSNREAVRIFTGAPVPEGADAILIQENTERDGAFLTALEGVTTGQYIRPAGLDFKKNDVLIVKGTLLEPAHLALAASMNHPEILVLRRPKVAILATGDELVLPGETPSDNQIIASNNFGVAALAKVVGADVLDLGIARDDKQAIASKIKQAQDAKVDILVSSGGVSVGEHDLVQDVLKEMGMDLAFWRIAMRPGKPLMAGKLGDCQVLGLPGNPVSAMVCAILFMQPLIRKMLGDSIPQRIERAILGDALAENDKRQSYLRATLSIDDSGKSVATPFAGQDSAMMAGLARASCLIIRPPHAKAANKGDSCDFIRL
ncbi:molybdopterin molybdotransferase MoeA [Cohaesibacter celericrescens]|uniref:molybdopterin molybdotransferase MoeA n=1 Tax=Cohaesibacter celericrescens TaxID=2067669 RepID=UPI00356546C4